MQLFPLTLGQTVDRLRVDSALCYDTCESVLKNSVNLKGNIRYADPRQRSKMKPARYWLVEAVAQKALSLAQPKNSSDRVEEV